jgi:lysophospholipase L1-like esterase
MTMGEETAKSAVSLKFKVIATLIMFLISLVVAELMLRLVSKDVFLQSRSKNGGLFVLFEADTSADLLSEEFRVRYDINQFGCRDKLDRTLKKKDGQKRIVVFGDSFTAGWGVEFNECYTTQLEESLGTEVINFGKNGGSALWFIHQIRYAVKRFNGDAIVIQFFDNDLNDNRVYSNFLDFVPGQKIGPTNPDLLPKEGLLTQSKSVLHSLELYRKIKALRRKLKGKKVNQSNYCKIGAYPDRKILSRSEIQAKYAFNPKEPPKWTDIFEVHNPELTHKWSQDLINHKQVVEQIFQEAKAAQKPIFIVYIPCISVLKQSLAMKDLSKNPLSKQLSELCGKYGAPFLDCRELFRADPDPFRFYYLRDGHLNKEGHASLAKAMAPKIKKWLAAK